jgi:hypothetical protein
MSILLEISEVAIKGLEFSNNDSLTVVIEKVIPTIAKAQTRKIFAELKKPCPHFDERDAEYITIPEIKAECSLCIAGMESEVK